MIPLLVLIWSGPPTLPIIGNLHQMPKKDIHLAYQRWSKQCTLWTMYLYDARLLLKRHRWPDIFAQARPNDPDRASKRRNDQEAY